MKKERRYQLNVGNSKHSTTYRLGSYDSATEMSHDYRVSATTGTDEALMIPDIGNPNDCFVYIILEVNGKRWEIPDPRIFREDLDLI